MKIPHGTAECGPIRDHKRYIVILLGEQAVNNLRYALIFFNGKFFHNRNCTTQKL
jgi:hypothetical protein